ncbi:MAG TPA: inositol monophosphatase family protein, partial [Polyangiaceae bacterium]|nr:inositol monophosphatase family protein [Polyangiaceae bacterium]
EKKLRPWDIAAGVVMVPAAGGMATALDGQPDNVLDGHIVATNGHLHARLVELLRQSRQSTDW